MMALKKATATGLLEAASCWVMSLKSITLLAFTKCLWAAGLHAVSAKVDKMEDPLAISSLPWWLRHKV